MSTDLHPTDHPEATTPRPRPGREASPRSSPASLAAGAAAALVLILGVFPGGHRERHHRRPSSAFGFGWALLAGLAGDAPTAPALGGRPGRGHGAAGLGLVVPSPGDAALECSAGSGRPWSWHWRSGCSPRSVGAGRARPVAADPGRRRCWASLPSPPSRGRRLVSDPSPSAAPGTTYDVDGHRLHLDCQGGGGPTVVLRNGLGESAASWSRIIDQVATTTRVCAYDRAGQGWSEAAADPQDGGASAPTCTRCSPGRRVRPLRARRALHRWHVRDDLRRPLPRAGRRPGAARQLEPRPADRHPQLRRPVRRHPPGVALLPTAAAWDPDAC